MGLAGTGDLPRGEAAPPDGVISSAGVGGDEGLSLAAEAGLVGGRQASEGGEVLSDGVHGGRCFVLFVSGVIASDSSTIGAPCNYRKRKLSDFFGSVVPSCPPTTCAVFSLR